MGNVNLEFKSDRGNSIENSELPMIGHSRVYTAV